MGSVYDPAVSIWTDILGGPAWSDKANWGNAEYYSTIQAVSVGGKIYLVARDGAGITGSVYDPTASSWTEISRGPTLSDPSWKFAQFYSTIRSVSANGKLYLFARGQSGIVGSVYDPTATSTPWTDITAPGAPVWSDVTGWTDASYYSTIRSNPL